MQVMNENEIVVYCVHIFVKANQSCSVIFHFIFEFIIC